MIGVNYDSENGDKENQEEPAIRDNFVQPVRPKEHEPMPLTKKEIEILQRRQLLSRLNHDDLSDLINSSTRTFCHLICLYFFAFEPLAFRPSMVGP